jgi:hypothetical protein
VIEYKTEQEVPRQHFLIEEDKMNPIVLVFGILLFGVGIVAFLLKANKLAEGEKPKFWTKIPEGYLIPLAKGGKFNDLLFNIVGHELDTNFNLWDLKEYEALPPSERAKYTLRPRVKTVLGELIGLHWIGWPPFYGRFDYFFSWNEHKKVDASGKYVVEPRSEQTSRFRFRASYVIPVKEAETSDGLKVDANLLITFQVWNVRTALQLINWLATASGRVSAEFNDFTRTLDRQKLLSLKTGAAEDDDEKKKNFVNRMIALNDKGGADTGLGLKELTGNRIIDAELLDYEVVGDKEEKEALAAEMVAKAQAAALIAKAKGTSEAIERELAPLNAVPLALAQAYLRRDGLVNTKLRAFSEGSSAGGILSTVSVDDPPAPKSATKEKGEKDKS